MRDADQHVERLARHAAVLFAIRVTKSVIILIIIVFVFAFVVIQSTVRRIAIAGTTRVVVAVGIGVGVRFERRRLQPQCLVDLHRAVPIGIQSGYRFRHTAGGAER